MPNPAPKWTPPGTQSNVVSLAARHMKLKGDPLVEWLESMNIPVTRENYINHNWPGDDMPDPWTKECEAQLPRELQDPTWEANGF